MSIDKVEGGLRLGWKGTGSSQSATIEVVEEVGHKFKESFCAGVCTEHDTEKMRIAPEETCCRTFT